MASSDLKTPAKKVKKKKLNIKGAIKSLQARASNKDIVQTSILPAAYELYFEIQKASKSVLEDYLATIDELVADGNLKTKPTKTQTKIIHLIFTKPSISTGRASEYGNVLRNAYQAKTRKNKLLEWVNSVGGYSKAARLGNTTAKSKQKTSTEDVLTLLAETDPIDSFKSKKVRKIIGNDFVLALCKWDTNQSKLAVYKFDGSENRVKSFVNGFSEDFMEKHNAEEAQKKRGTARKSRAAKIAQIANKHERKNGTAD